MARSGRLLCKLLEHEPCRIRIQMIQSHLELLFPQQSHTEPWVLVSKQLIRKIEKSCHLLYNIVNEYKLEN